MSPKYFPPKSLESVVKEFNEELERQITRKDEQISIFLIDMWIYGAIYEFEHKLKGEDCEFE